MISWLFVVLRIYGTERNQSSTRISALFAHIAIRTASTRRCIRERHATFSVCREQRMILEFLINDGDDSPKYPLLHSELLTMSPHDLNADIFVRRRGRWVNDVGLSSEIMFTVCTITRVRGVAMREMNHNQIRASVIESVRAWKSQTCIDWRNRRLVWTADNVCIN